MYDSMNNHQKIALQFYGVNLELEVCGQGVNQRGP